MPVDDNDMLAASGQLGGVAEKAEAFQHIEQHCIADRQDDRAAGHPVIFRDDRLLAFGQVGMRAYLNGKTLLPKCVFLGRRAWFAEVIYVEDSGQQKVFELVGDVTIAANVPA